MKKWEVMLLVSVVVILLVVAAGGLYLYNKYLGDLRDFQKSRSDADDLFSLGIIGPNNCSSFVGCVVYCNSNRTGCVQFCENNPENGLCALIVYRIESGELSLDDLEMEDVGSENVSSDAEDDGVGDDEEDAVEDDDEDDPIVLCAEDSVSGSYGYSYYALDMTGPICMGHAIDECASLGKIVDEDFFEEGLLCCEWNCLDAPIDCSDSDDGSDIWIKGSCTDAVGVDTDACSTGADFTDFVDETWCTDGICMGASFSCFNEGATCYDGRCILNDQDSDSDGYTDLDEYTEGTDPNDELDYPVEDVDCAAECMDAGGFIYYVPISEMELACLETGMDFCTNIGESLMMTQDTANCCCIGCMLF